MVFLSAIPWPKNKTKDPLTKKIVMITLSLEKGLWKVLVYLVVASACKSFLAVILIFGGWCIILNSQATLRKNCFLWEVYTTLITHSMPPFEFGFWCCYIYFRSLMPSTIQVLSE